MDLANRLGVTTIWSGDPGLTTSVIAATLGLSSVPLIEISARYWRDAAKMWAVVDLSLRDVWGGGFGKNWDALHDVMTHWCRGGRLFVIRDISAHRRDNIARFVDMVVHVWENPILQPHGPVAVVLSDWGRSKVIAHWPPGKRVHSVRDLDVVTD